MPIINLVYEAPEQWWQPWANTVAYYPLVADFNDESWNNKDLSTYTWTPTITTLNWVSCAYYDWSSISRNTSISAPIANRTIMAWLNCTGSGRIMWVWSNVSAYWDYWQSWLQLNNALCIDDTRDVYSTTQTLPSWWFHLCLAQSWATCTMYINWQYIQEANNMPTTWNSATWTMVVLGGKANYSYSEKYTWYISNAIVEDKTWNATEVSDYYNQTKWYYWL